MGQKLLLLAAAGAAGALARYGLAGLVQRGLGTAFPWATLVVNVAGCFLFGLVWAVGEERMAIGPGTRTILLVGFLGAFTTFSTFTFETSELLHDARYLAAAGNILGQVALGIVGLLGGIALGRLI